MTNFSFSFGVMDTIVRNLSSGDFAYNWYGEQVGIITMKFQINENSFAQCKSHSCYAAVAIDRGTA